MRSCDNEPYPLWSDRQLLIAYKPAGWLSQAEDHPTLPNMEEWAASFLKKEDPHSRPFVRAAHRLDVPVEGILCLARSSKSLSRVHEAQRQRRWHKLYLARTTKPLPDPEATVIHFLRQSDGKALLRTTPASGYQQAQLQYLRLSPQESLIRLDTGRYHQIRAQLAAIGSPIVGDVKYGGGPPLNKSGGIRLAHVHLVMDHPISGDEVNVLYSPSWASQDWATQRHHLLGSSSHEP